MLEVAPPDVWMILPYHLHLIVLEEHTLEACLHLVDMDMSLHSISYSGTQQDLRRSCPHGYNNVDTHRATAARPPVR